MDEAYRLWRVRRTVHEMLKDRDYIVKEEDLTMSFNDFKEKFGTEQTKTGIVTIQRDKLLVMASKQNDPVDMIFVFFPAETRLGVKHIKEIHTRMKDNEVKRAILVLQPNISSTQRTLSAQSKRAIDGLAARGYIIETFQEGELLVNITHHVLVPNHIPMTDEEKKALMARYKLKETQLPRIRTTDPVARYYGLQRGQVVKIIRPSETAGRYITYRLVV